MTWSQEVREQAQAIVDRYPEPRSAVMPLLYVAMRESGGLTSGGMRQVAEFTGLTPVQVESVASFYSMFKHGEVGKYVISGCTSISCHLLGGDDVLAAVSDETGAAPGETDEEGVVFVERAECIGACGGAPAVQVNYEMVEGIDADAARRMCRWLADEKPDVIVADELQAEFGGQRSFEWGPADSEGAVGPVPAFGPLGTTGAAR